MAQALHQRVKPLRVAGAFDPDGDGPWQRAIELLDRVVIVGEPTFLPLARLGVEDCDLLTPSV
jgi:hypothetical protein